MQVCASRTEHRQAEQREEQPGRSTPRVVPRHGIQKNDPGHRAFNSIARNLNSCETNNNSISFLVLVVPTETAARQTEKYWK